MYIGVCIHVFRVILCTLFEQKNTSEIKFVCFKILAGIIPATEFILLC